MSNFKELKGWQHLEAYLKLKGVAVEAHENEVFIRVEEPIGDYLEDDLFMIDLDEGKLCIEFSRNIMHRYNR